MIKKKLTAAVLALGISASLLFQMPVSATAQGAEQTSPINFSWCHQRFSRK